MRLNSFVYRFKMADWQNSKMYKQWEFPDR